MLARIGFLLLLVSSCAPVESGTKAFVNKYCRFELPVGWSCRLKGKEWVCRGEGEGMMVLTAKKRGAKDDLASYMAALKQNKVSTLNDGRQLVSTPEYAKIVAVNGYRWVDAFHTESEIPGYFTRYMATVKGTLGIVVTFSAPMKPQTRAGEHRQLFDKVAASLQVIR